jgi:hypothetical protein
MNRVEAEWWFVEEEDFRAGGDGTRQADALLACRRRARRARGRRRGGEADLGEDDVSLARASARWPSLRARRPKATFSQTGRLSKRRRSGTACRCGRGGLAVVAAHGEQVLAVDLDRAGVGLDEAEDAFEQDGFAGAGTADELTMEVPGMTSRSMPSRTVLSPKRLLRRRTRSLGVMEGCFFS